MIGALATLAMVMIYLYISWDVRLAILVLIVLGAMHGG